MYTDPRAYSDIPQRSSRPRRRRRRRRRFPLLPILASLTAVFLLSRAGTHLAGILPDIAPLPPSSISFFENTALPSGTEGGASGDTSLMEQLRQLADEEPQAAPLLEHPENYPEALLELALRNRETLDFVLNYPEYKDSVPAASVGTVTQGEFPLLMQWDQRWGYTQYGDGLLAYTGCGPTTLAMVVCGLTGDGTVTPGTVATYADQAGYYVDGQGTSWELMYSGCQAFGVSARELPLSRSVLVSALEQGEPVICSVGPGDFTTSGHFIVLTGMQDGMFRVNDPNRRSTSQQLWDYDTLSPQIRNLWAYTRST